MELVGGVVDRGVTGGRVLDPTLVMQTVNHDEIVHRAAVAAILDAGFQPVPTATIHRHRQAGVGQAGLGLDVHHAGRLETVLRRQSARDQRQAPREAFGDRLTEDRQPLRQFLERRSGGTGIAGALAAEMDLPGNCSCATPGACSRCTGSRARRRLAGWPVAPRARTTSCWSPPNWAESADGRDRGGRRSRRCPS